MSEKIKALKYIEALYEKYLKYKSALNKNTYSKEDLFEQLKPHLESSSQDLEDMVVDLIVDYPNQEAEVNRVATAFVVSCDMYSQTEEEVLPKEILEEYMKLKSKTVPPQYSIVQDKFKRVSKEKLITKDNFKELIEAIKKQIDN